MHVPLWPPVAATNAGQVDALYIFLLVVTVVMTILIFLGVFIFAVKYRRRNEDEVPLPIEGHAGLEIVWSVLPLGIMMIMFGWGTKLFFDNAVPPANTLDIYVVGKQWMWKVQHPEGPREINELHVPLGRPVKLTLASEDVIHSFFIPAFRVKHDVVPGRYNTLWFEATETGRFHLFCAEYCGTQHSGMIGWVTVMEPNEYQNWLAGGGAGGSMTAQGMRLFQQLGCSSCHLSEQAGRCPTLRGVYGKPVSLADGRSVLADDAYIRESILNPNAKIVSGYQKDVMPTFQGVVNEDDLLQLLVYVKSLATPAGVPASPSGLKTGSAKQ